MIGRAIIVVGSHPISHGLPAWQSVIETACASFESILNPTNSSLNEAEKTTVVTDVTTADAIGQMIKTTMQVTLMVTPALDTPIECLRTPSKQNPSLGRLGSNFNNLSKKEKSPGAGTKIYSMAREMISMMIDGGPPHQPFYTTQQAFQHYCPLLNLPILEGRQVIDRWAMKDGTLLWGNTDYPIWEVLQNGKCVSTKDAKQKFLKVFTCCPGPKVFESDIKGSTASSSSTQNVAFISSESTNNLRFMVQVSPLKMSIRSFLGLSSAIKDEQENFALMAHSNSGSNTEVTSCSKECEESYAKLMKLYDEQREQLGVAKAVKEKEELKTKLENFQSSTKGLSKLLNSPMSTKDKSGLGRSSDVEDIPMNDRFAKVEGMHAVPPPMTGIYMPSKSDFGIDYVETPDSVPKPAVNEPTTVNAFDDLNDDLVHGIDYMDIEEAVTKGRQSKETEQQNVTHDTEEERLIQKMKRRKQMYSEEKRFLEEPDTMQKTDSDLEEEEHLKTFLKLVPDEEGIIDYEVLEKRFPIINWESKFYHLDKWSKLDLEELYNLNARQMNASELGIPNRILSTYLGTEDSASESAYNLLRFIQKQIDEYGSYDGSEKDL
ncbi:hypothetical protein Tco_0259958 [Tanacetum coccineum]